MYDLKDIVGHDNIKEFIHNVLASKKIPHAYIFEGEKGCGKLLTAKTFAKILQCSEDEYGMCGKCKSCLQMESNNQPDVIVLSKSKKNYTIDDIRTGLTSDVQIKPYAGPYKIYIIPEAHLLRDDSQNALLKTIEEPPEYAIIILLTENAETLLATIRSRCVTLKFNMVDMVKIKKYLMENYNIPEYQAGTSAVFADGNIGKAIRYAENEDFVSIRNEVIGLLKSIDDMSEYEVMVSSKKIADNKDNILEYLDLMQLWIRDILVYKSTNNDNMILFREEMEYIKDKARLYSYEKIDRMMASIAEAKGSMKLNVNVELILELMLAKF